MIGEGADAMAERKVFDTAVLGKRVRTASKALSPFRLLRFGVVLSHVNC